MMSLGGITDGEQVLDLSASRHRQQQQQEQETASCTASTAYHRDVYRRYTDDLERLDGLINHRIYERNVLNWKRQNLRHSLERIRRLVSTFKSYAVST